MCKKKEEEHKIEKEREVERSYQVRRWVHLSYYLFKTLLREVEGTSATPSKLKSQATNQMLSKLARAYQTPKHAAQMRVSKNT